MASLLYRTERKLESEFTLVSLRKETGKVKDANDLLLK